MQAGKLPSDLWTPRSPDEISYSGIEAAASTVPMMGRWVHAAKPPGKLKLLFSQGDSIVPADDETSEAVGDIAQILELSKIVADNSPELHGLYSNLRCAIHVMASFFRYALRCKTVQDAAGAIHQAAKLASATLHLDKNINSRQMLASKNFGLLSGSFESSLYLGPMTSLPGQDVSKFYVGLITDSTKLGIQDKLALLMSMARDGPTTISIQVVRDLYSLVKAFVFEPFRILEPGTGSATIVQTCAYQLVQLLLRTRVQSGTFDDHTFASMTGFAFTRVMEEAKYMTPRKRSEILHAAGPVWQDDKTSWSTFPASGEPCISYHGDDTVVSSPLLTELRVRDRRKLVRWRRATEAERDAGRVFRAASEGRPMELEKRLRLGKLAGGLQIKGSVAEKGGAKRMMLPLDAARLGEHDECVKLLEEALA